MKAYPININNVQVLVEHDGFNVRVVSDNRTRELVTPHDFRQFMDAFHHTGIPTGQMHSFVQYKDGTIIGVHGNQLLTKLPRLVEVNTMLCRRNIEQFSKIGSPLNF